ncbi:MAG: aspartyl protease family protein [Prevotellaceae bacterium]|jgi:hypothetical protein|nr:aspartyl protease family protein [Prevotellaceae bacterium]
MRRILGVFLILSCANILLAQEFNFNQAQADSTGYYITLPYKNVNDKLIVSAELGGKVRSFIFDTGAATCISQILADELILTPKEVASAVDQSGKRNSIPIVLIKEFILGGVAFKEVPSLAFEKSVFFDCFNVDGFIGSNLLHNSIVQFTDSTIIITDRLDSLGLNKRFATKLYLDKAQSNPYFYIKLNNIKIQLLFDSGSNELMAMSTDDFERLKDRRAYRLLGSSYGNSSVGMFGVAENVDVYRIYIPRFTLGKNRLANAVVQTTEGVSRMGIKILEHGKVTIDYINKQFYFEPDDPDNPYTNVKEHYWTISPGIQDGMLIVGTVWDDLGQNVNQGDRILAIDGVSYRERTDCEVLLKPLIDKEKNEAVLTIENKNGVRRNIKIIKQ